MIEDMMIGDMMIEDMMIEDIVKQNVISQIVYLNKRNIKQYILYVYYNIYYFLSIFYS